ncbi:glutathione peroxidase [Paenibacillus sp. YYML68]|uniref:glutathione peroxidase n=1 Tax=Paenibacillus sp. YYML68 TaxID=2909250 RepID=UPI002493ACF8|nr:glutathione peroxidase [Paenibacillus sp. YYML68]
MSTVYEYIVKDIHGNDLSLRAYEGRVLLFVNVASKCGFTAQYAGLEKLYQDYKEQGLVIIGVPCNQFGGQEPGTEEEISSFCSTNYGVTFPLLSKMDVRGEEKHPLYVYLTENAPLPPSDDAKGIEVRWNFTKFLVDRSGRVLKRFESGVEPRELASDIEALLTT